MNTCIQLNRNDLISVAFIGDDFDSKQHMTQKYETKQRMLDLTIFM